MKKLILFGFTLILAAGCSSKPTESSPQEKRNNFDACLIEKGQEYRQQLKDAGDWLSDDSIKKLIDQKIPSLCVDLLK